MNCSPGLSPSFPAPRIVLAVVPVQDIRLPNRTPSELRSRKEIERSTARTNGITLLSRVSRQNVAKPQKGLLEKTLSRLRSLAIFTTKSALSFGMFLFQEAPEWLEGDCSKRHKTGRAWLDRSVTTNVHANSELAFVFTGEGIPCLCDVPSLIMLCNHFPRSGASQEPSCQYCGISNLRYAGFNMSRALVIFAAEKKSAREFHDNLSQNLCQMAGACLIHVSHPLLS
jgi:hypothetical protein